MKTEPLPNGTRQTVVGKGQAHEMDDFFTGCKSNGCPNGFGNGASIRA